jgi:hypothetical protein
LARPVAADDTYDLARLYLERHVPQSPEVPVVIDLLPVRLLAVSLVRQQHVVAARQAAKPTVHQLADRASVRQAELVALAQALDSKRERPALAGPQC